MALAAGLGLGLLLFCLLWLNLVSLPGNWLMLAVLCPLAWLGPTGWITWKFVGIMACVALLGEFFELAGQLIGGAHGGASRKGNFGGIVGSIVGAVLGAPFALGLGGIAGALAGAWLGCFVAERLRGAPSPVSARAAWGALRGRGFGLIGKTAAGATIIVASVRAIISRAA